MTIWFAHCFVPGPGYGLVCPVLSSRARACRRDHQAPSAPLPDVGVAFVRETFPPPAETLLSGHRSYEHMCQSRVALLCFGSITSFEESLQVATSPCCQQDLLDVILRVFPWLLGPLPRRSHRVHAPVNFPDVIGLPLGRLGRLPALVHDATFRGERFSRLQTFRHVQATKFVRLPGCSHRYSCEVGRPRLLRPGRTCIVASARTGYASRPNTGN